MSVAAYILCYISLLFPFVFGLWQVLDDPVYVTWHSQFARWLDKASGWGKAGVAAVALATVSAATAHVVAVWSIVAFVFWTVWTMVDKPVEYDFHQPFFAVAVFLSGVTALIAALVVAF